MLLSGLLFSYLSDANAKLVAVVGVLMLIMLVVIEIVEFSKGFDDD